MKNRQNAIDQQHEAIRSEYARQAPGWRKERFDTDLAWIIDRTEIASNARVLDVAAGSGLVSRALASRAGRVTALDLTPEMFRDTARDRPDLLFQQGAAERLPYRNGVFDLVATRFTVHHFVDPSAVISETHRVCRKGGALLLIDLTSPDDEATAERYNGLERLRDSTHTEALTARGLARLVSAAGFVVLRQLSRNVEVDLEEWLDFSQTDPAARHEITSAVERELAGGEPTGLAPYESGNRLKFTHRWGIVHSRKAD